MLRMTTDKRKQVLEDARTIGRWTFYALVSVGLTWMILSAIRTITIVHANGGLR